jgi:hypothetical protein
MTPEYTRLELPADAVPHLTLAWTRHTHDPSGRQHPPPPSPTEEEMEAWLASDPWEHPWERDSDASSVGSAYDEVEARPGFDTEGFLNPLGASGQRPKNREVPRDQSQDVSLSVYGHSGCKRLTLGSVLGRSPSRRVHRRQKGAYRWGRSL